MKKRIYLAGSIYENEIDIKWKDDFINYLGQHPRKYYLYDPNPLKEYDPLKLGMINHDVVAMDKRTIDNSDFVVAYVNKASFGTAMEIQYAFSKQNIAIYVINPNGLFDKDIWLTYHASMFFKNVQDCANQINMICNNVLVYHH